MNSSNIYRERIGQLRRLMKERCWDAVVVTGTDPHSSEYPAPRWKQVEWLTGFTGEAGDVVVTQDHAGLWTDSRYFIQAGVQLAGTGVELHKTRIPGEVTIPNWLAAHFNKDFVTVAIDGLCHSDSSVAALEEALGASYGVEGFDIQDWNDMLDDLWKDRPAVPHEPILVLDEETVGETRRKKIDWLRGVTSSLGCSAILLSSLDEIAWMLNVRGEDIEYNPYVISYLLVSDKKVSWYVRKDDSQPIPRLHGVEVLDYSEIGAGVMNVGGRLIVDNGTANSTICRLAREMLGEKSILFRPSPVALRKAVKNPVEVEGFRKAFFLDGIAVEKFLFWLENEVASGRRIDEWEASEKLTSLRAEIPGYRGNSFENISAYGCNAALPHYSTPREGSAAIEPHGLYLTDSGGQYLFGTTDITRTVPMGECSQLEKEDYTVVLKGMIDLSMAVFPLGTAGCQIDALAREPMWSMHRNFGHGTGHGIGFFLGVHEGPQSIRQNFLSQAMLPGMVTSNEPGLYREGMHGIRHENVVLCTGDGADEFGEWLKFETLTCCHIDTAAILPEMLTEREKEWLNGYNAEVFERLSPHLDAPVAEWLRKKTASI